MQVDDLVLLLVEDTKDDEILTLRAFKKVGITNTIVVARDGAEALEFLFGTGAHATRDASVLPRLVLLDLNLPRLGGLEVLQRIREDPRTRDLPVVILTSSKEEEDISRSKALGANAYVRKPVGFAEFAEAVRQLGLTWRLFSPVLPTADNAP